MAVPPIGPDISICIHGLHPLQSPGGWEDIKPRSLCGAGRDSRGLQRNLKHYRRGKRNQQVLAGDIERPA